MLISYVGLYYIFIFVFRQPFKNTETTVGSQAIKKKKKNERKKKGKENRPLAELGL